MSVCTKLCIISQLIECDGKYPDNIDPICICASFRGHLSARACLQVCLFTCICLCRCGAYHSSPWDSAVLTDSSIRGCHGDDDGCVLGYHGDHCLGILSIMHNIVLA